MAAYSV